MRRLRGALSGATAASRRSCSAGPRRGSKIGQLLVEFVYERPPQPQEGEEACLTPPVPQRKEDAVEDSDDTQEAGVRCWGRRTPSARRRSPAFSRLHDGGGPTAAAGRWHSPSPEPGPEPGEGGASRGQEVPGEDGHADARRDEELERLRRLLDLERSLSAQRAREASELHGALEECQAALALRDEAEARHEAEAEAGRRTWQEEQHVSSSSSSSPAHHLRRSGGNEEGPSAWRQERHDEVSMRGVRSCHGGKNGLFRAGKALRAQLDRDGKGGAGGKRSQSAHLGGRFGRAGGAGAGDFRPPPPQESLLAAGLLPDEDCCRQLEQAASAGRIAEVVTQTATTDGHPLAAEAAASELEVYVAALQAHEHHMEQTLHEEEAAAVDLRRRLEAACEEAEASHLANHANSVEAHNLRVWKGWLRQRLDDERDNVTELQTELAMERATAELRAAAVSELTSEVSELSSSRQRLLGRLEQEAGGVDSAAESSAETERASMLTLGLPALTGEEIEQVTGGFRARLGLGGFGEVFAGTACGSCPAGFTADVAVKIPKICGTCADQQFLREVRVGGIQDPHLVPLLAVCIERRALVYPRASICLEGRLRAADRPGPTEGLRLLLGAARGLHVLHRRGLAHRDVKSANVLLFPERVGGADGDGEVVYVARLGDCGWALDVPSEPAATGPSAVPCTLVGTAAYLDPELQASGRCSRSSDIFSLGVVMLEVLLRRSTTERGRDARPMWRQLNEALPFAREGAPAMAAAATAFIRGAGAAEGWQSQALGRAAALVVDAVKERITQVRPVDRPTAAAVVQRLEGVEALQLVTGSVPPPPAASVIEGRICTICFEEPISARLQPCCHAMACAACARSFTHGLCPVCRTEVTGFDVGVFDSTFSPG